MFKKIALLCTLFISTFAFAIPSNIVEGQQYFASDLPRSEKNEVIEVFSFLCGACYNLNRSGSGKLLEEKLPKGTTFVRYLTPIQLPFSEELQQSWAIANVLGIADEYADRVFDGFFVTKNIRSESDLIAIMNSLNITTEKYEAMKRDPFVLSFIKRQNEMLVTLQPKFTPSFYVNQKYLLNPEQLSDYQSYINTINYLISLK